MKITAKSVGGGKPVTDQTINEIIERLVRIEADLRWTKNNTDALVRDLLMRPDPEKLVRAVLDYPMPDTATQSSGSDPDPAPAPEQPSDQKPASRVERMFGARETWTTERGNHAPSGRTPVKGFLHLTCPDCGNSFTTFLKEPKDVFYCRSCGGKIPLDFPQLRRFRAACHKCGANPITYRTNSNDTNISVWCRNCGAEIDGVLHRLRDEYETI